MDQDLRKDSCGKQKWTLSLFKQFYCLPFGHLWSTAWSFVRLPEHVSLILPLLHLSFSLLFNWEHHQLSGVCAAGCQMHGELICRQAFEAERSNVQPFYRCDLYRYSNTRPIKAYKGFLESWHWNGGTWNKAFMAAGTSVEGSGVRVCPLQILQKRKKMVLPLLVTACVNSAAPCWKRPVRVAFPWLDLIFKTTHFFHLRLSIIRLLAVPVYVLENHGILVAWKL